MALEGLNAGDARQLGPVQGAIGHDHIPGLHRVAAIGGDEPAAAVVVPGHAGDFRLEAGVAVEVEVAPDGPAVGQDLGRGGVFGFRHVADLFQQRQVDIGLHIAGRAGIAVPVPGAAEVAALFDEADIVDPRLAQASAGQQTAKAAADHHRLDLVGQGFAGEALRHIGVIQVMGELALDLAVLFVGLGAQALVALFPVLGPQERRVEAQVVGAVRVYGLEVVRHRSVSLGGDRCELGDRRSGRTLAYLCGGCLGEN